MSALRPMVQFLQNKKIPRFLAVSVTYFSFVLFFSFLLVIVIPPIVTQIISLISSLPLMLQSLNPQMARFINVDSLAGYLPNVTNVVFQFASGLFSNLLFIVSTLFFGFYFLLEENILKNLFDHFLPEATANRVIVVIQKAEKRMSSWFWGELVLMTIIGVMTFIGLQFVNMSYILPLAVLAGLLEVVPNIGPIISVIPAFIIGISQSYIMGISTIVLYTLIQQLENNIIVPVIMKKAVGINPIMSLIVLIIGGKLGGILGVLLSIPVYLIAETIFEEIMKNHTLLQRNE
jgi:predicted PurR-regulated permease PerM